MYSDQDTSLVKLKTTVADRLEFKDGSGLPHSEISGSKVAHTSPELIAACHVLHRLCMPRHPPIALTSRSKVHTTNGNADKLCRCRIRIIYVSLSLDRVRQPTCVDRHHGSWHRFKTHSQCQIIGSIRPTPRERRIYALFIPRKLVEPVGIEPTTSSLQS